MIIVPEIKTVVILVPRTGTRSLKNALLKAYPQSFLLYRHMEADGIPQGYDRWRRCGVVRHPIDRLWSLYKYLANFGLDWTADHDDVYTHQMRRSVTAPFEDWMVLNELVFTQPYDSSGQGRFYPEYTVRHPLPENRKSQYHYLRPDLGTEIWSYSEISDFHRSLGLAEIKERFNKTENVSPPELSIEGQEYANKWFAWDYSFAGGESDDE